MTTKIGSIGNGNQSGFVYVRVGINNGISLFQCLCWISEYDERQPSIVVITDKKHKKTATIGVDSKPLFNKTL